MRFRTSLCTCGGNAGPSISAPGPGVTLQLNDRVVAHTPKHDVIDALLHTWAEGDPVPQRVNQVVSKHPCAR